MKPRLSSCTILARVRDGVFELFWAKRRPELAFLGGFHAFPGGSLEDGDAEVPLHGEVEDADLRALLGCAARELFEEVGLLFTREGPISKHNIDASSSPLTSAQLEQMRSSSANDSDQNSGEEHFLDALLAASLPPVDAQRYRPIGRWITPEWIPIRFETEFFLVVLTQEEAARVHSDAICEDVQASELQDAQWITPAEAVRKHEHGEVMLSAPTIAILRQMDAQIQGAEHKSLERVDQDAMDPLTLIEHIGGTYMISLESPTIPPATHTNCAIIGQETFVVVDPGTEDPKQLAMLYPAIDTLLERGATFQAIVLTHHHVDHVCGVPALLERYGNIPLWAHEITGELLGSKYPRLARTLADGDTIALDGGAHDLECVFTPGHAPGHIALLHKRSNTMFSGDLVASKGTILVRPPEGHMGDYLASLARVKEMNVNALHPSHGWTIVAPRQKLEEYEQHRLAREEQVFVALEDHSKATSGAWAEPMDLVPSVYTDVPESVWFLAAMSLTAHLIHLHEIGRAERDRDMLRFRSVAS